MIRQAADIATGLRRIAPVLGIVLAGCMTSEPPKPDDNMFPARYKEEVIQHVQTSLQDPTNIRDAFISEPVLASVGTAQRWTACVRFNPRAAGRRYTGSEDRFAIYYGG